MCGIMGCIAPNLAVSTVMEGLRLLEYRGYDSSGIAVLKNGSIRLYKKAGRISVLASLLSEKDYEGSACIGHTRWATHGKPADENAHPFFSMDHAFALVHNGVIENCLELKKFLLDRGFSFTSGTDSEVIVHLIQFYYKGDTLRALSDAVTLLKGSFAIVVLSSYDKDSLFFAKKDNPLVLGVENGCGYACSDVLGISSHLHSCVIPDDFRLGVVTNDRISLYDFSLQPVSYAFVALQKESPLSLDGYKHFMEKEIAEIPDAIHNALRSFSTSFHPSVFASVKRLILIGCGTAYHAGLVAKTVLREFLPTLDCYCVPAGEFLFEEYPIDDTLFVAISQSGETADTLNAVKKIKRKNGRVLAICNVPSSSMVREADLVYLTSAGPEIAVASTKAYNSQLAVLLSFCVQLILFFGKASLLPEDISCQMLSLPDFAEAVLKTADQIASIARENKNVQSVFYLGRGLDYCVAMEGSLKLKEISYVHSEAYTAGELKHGPLALIESGTLVIAIITQKKTLDKMVTCLSEVKSRGAKILCITKFDSEKISSLCEYTVLLPDTADMLSPILSVIPTQLFSYYSALYRHKDIDKPRNLAKSVTVE